MFHATSSSVGNDEKGVVRYPERFVQPVSFRGLRWGSITPSDIDAMVEFGNRAVVFIEAKCQGVSMPLGQRLALERAVDGLWGSGFHSLLVVAKHNTPIGQAVDLASCEVVKYREKGKWKPIVGRSIAVKVFVDQWLSAHQLDWYLR